MVHENIFLTEHLELFSQTVNISCISKRIKYNSNVYDHFSKKILFLGNKRRNSIYTTGYILGLKLLLWLSHIYSFAMEVALFCSLWWYSSLYNIPFEITSLVWSLCDQSDPQKMVASKIAAYFQFFLREILHFTFPVLVIMEKEDSSCIL